MPPPPCPCPRWYVYTWLFSSPWSTEPSSQAAIESPLKRQATVPVEEASKSDGGPVLPYKRRDVAVQDASKSDGGVVLPYKRQTVAVQDASKSDGTVVVAYERRDVPVQVASKSDGTNVVPYKRYSEIPLEVAVRSVDGVVELY